MSGRQLVATLATLGLMALFGFGVWTVLGTLQTKVSAVTDPTQQQALVDLPGTVVVAQGGSLYRLHGLNFTKLNTAPGDWVQVAPGPNGDLLAVDKGNGYSNVMLLNPQGQTIRLLLQESSRQFFNNHFAYYPRLSANGQTLFYAWNWVDPYANYNVDFEIQAVPLANPSQTPTQWSIPNNYQGGDVEPLPLAKGGLLYAKYAVESTTGATYSQLVFVASPEGQLNYLTTPAQNCSEPAINPQGTELAMICTDNQTQTSTLQVASWNGSALGTPRVLSAGPMAAMPTWSPDGRSLIFMDPLQRSYPFQLWWIPAATTSKPGTPQQVTQNLDLTATSAPVWYP